MFGKKRAPERERETVTAADASTMPAEELAGEPAPVQRVFAAGVMMTSSAIGDPSTQARAAFIEQAAAAAVHDCFARGITDPIAQREAVRAAIARARGHLEQAAALLAGKSVTG